VTGFYVKPDYLDDAAGKLDELGVAVTSAKDALATNGDLPTLDPLSRAMAVVMSVAISAPLGPLGGLAGYFGGKAASRVIDPYPGVRAAWLAALPRYQALLARDATELRESARTYREKEHRGRKRFEGIDPMPRVPGSPTEPMPRVPGSPAVPMPTRPMPTPGRVRGNGPI
jgi:hypothetical protein